MIEVKDLKKVYKPKRGAVVRALDGVSLLFPERGMVFILGKSGSGKSTLLNVIGGLDSVDEGEIIIKGKSAKNFGQSDYDSYRNTYVGFIFQEYNVLEELTVGANIALAIELQGRRAEDEEINAILKEVDLEGYGARKPHELSGGQKQRVAIARALVKHPEIIMADEPTGALDSETGKQIFNTLKSLSKDKLVIIVSHDREFSEQYADRIIELKDGKVISDVEKVSAESEPAAEEEAGLRFGENEISVAAGYCLTEEDRLAINEYLASLSRGAKIVPASGARAKSAGVVTSANFAPTDEGKIRKQTEGFRLIKSRLSVKNSFKIGSSALKYKKFRLVFTIFLSLIAFSLFGVADTIAAYDSVETATNSILDSSVNYASFAKEVKIRYNTGDSDFYWSSGYRLSDEDIELIKEKTGIDVVGIYKPRSSSLSFWSALGEKGEKYTELYGSTFSGITSISAAFVAEHGFSLEGEFPVADDEIVISSFIFDLFKSGGFRDANGDKFEISKKSDLIGRSIVLDGENAYKIVGILDTGFDYERYLPLIDEDAQADMNVLVAMALSYELSAARSYSYACLVFVSPSTLSEMTSGKNNAFSEISGYVLLYPEGTDENEKYKYTSYINSFAELSSDVDVVWRGGEKTTLASNEVIVSMRTLMELMTDQTLVYDLTETLYNNEKLIGYEKTLSEKSYRGEYGISVNYLADVLENVSFYAAFRYAENNYEAAKNALVEWADENGFSFNAEELSEAGLPALFASLHREYGLCDGVVSEESDKYFSELVKRYSLDDFVISGEAAKKLVATVEHAGSTYKTSDVNSLRITYMLTNGNNDSIRYILTRRYAAEHFDAAKAYYCSQNGITASELDLVPAREIIELYSNHLLKDNSVDTVNASLNRYVTEGFMEFYDEAFGDVAFNLYAQSISILERNDIKIVGILPGGVNNDRDSMVVSSELYEKIFGKANGGIYSFALGDMPNEKSAVKNAVYFSRGEFDDTYRFTIMNNVTEELSMVDEVLAVLGSVFLYVGIGFAVFAALMLMNFIGTSITYKKHDIGILRAIGSRSADVFRIFFAESFIIAMINYVLSTIGTALVCSVINNTMRESVGLLITFLSFGIRQCALLLLVSLLVAVVATFLPVRRIAAMKPIDAIKNRK